MSIYFYSVNDSFGCFSNFAPYGFILDDKWWMTSEHYFQAQKFKNTKYEDMIRLVDSPMKAAKIGRKCELPLRKDWEEVKDNVMRKAVYAKFSQNPKIKEILLSTKEELLIEKTSNDYYWGCGTNGNGRNMLGNILMEVRGLLKNTC